MSRRPRLLDAFSCAGGAAMGYHRAGYEVTGVDNRPQPRYPFSHNVGDALAFIAEHGHEYDVIHASPPCQRYAAVTKWRGTPDAHPDLLHPTIALLEALDWGGVWIVENVMGAPMRADYVLCGSQFGLKVRRHRQFQTSWGGFSLTQQCAHRSDDLPFMHKGERAFADAMGCTWMTNREARQAIPPAYTEFLGSLAMEQLGQRSRPLIPKIS